METNDVWHDTNRYTQHKVSFTAPTKQVLYLPFVGMPTQTASNAEWTGAGSPSFPQSSSPSNHGYNMYII